MKQEQVLSLIYGGVMTASGPKQAIGNAVYELGDWVWTDGGVVFGNERKKSGQPTDVEAGSIVMQATYSYDFDTETSSRSLSAYVLPKNDKAMKYVGNFGWSATADGVDREFIGYVGNQKGRFIVEAVYGDHVSLASFNLKTKTTTTLPEIHAFLDADITDDGTLAILGKRAYVRTYDGGYSSYVDFPVKIVDGAIVEDLRDPIDAAITDCINNATTRIPQSMTPSYVANAPGIGINSNCILYWQHGKTYAKGCRRSAIVIKCTQFPILGKDSDGLWRVNFFGGHYNIPGETVIDVATALADSVNASNHTWRIDMVNEYMYCYCADNPGGPAEANANSEMGNGAIIWWEALNDNVGQAPWASESWGNQVVEGDYGGNGCVQYRWPGDTSLSYSDAVTISTIPFRYSGELTNLYAHIDSDGAWLADAKVQASVYASIRAQVNGSLCDEWIVDNMLIDSPLIIASNVEKCIVANNAGNVVDLSLDDYSESTSTRSEWACRLFLKLPDIPVVFGVLIGVPALSASNYTLRSGTEFKVRKASDLSVINVLPIYQPRWFSADATGVTVIDGADINRFDLSGNLLLSVTAESDVISTRIPEIRYPSAKARSDAKAAGELIDGGGDVT